MASAPGTLPEAATSFGSRTSRNTTSSRPTRPLASSGEIRADPASALHDANFDRAKTIVAYCASGGRSALVLKTLHDMGYANVRNLGGFKGWVDAGGEVEKP